MLYTVTFMLRRIFIFLSLLFAAATPPSAAAWSLDTGNETVNLTGPQFKDFLNEWSFLAAAPAIGPDQVVPRWKPWFQLAHNVRLVRPVEAGWTLNEPVASDADAALHLPYIVAGVGLPADLHTSVFFGASPNLRLQTLGFDISYPFILPSVSTPGLWARFSWSLPMGLPGMTVHLPAFSLYLTNEFFRTPVGGNEPLTVRIRAGVHQNLVVTDNYDIENARGDLRSNLFFPAATLFTAGLGTTWKGWAFDADVGYASSQTFIGGRNRVRAQWNQQYRISWAWPEVEL